MSVNPLVSGAGKQQPSLEKENLPARMREFLREPPASGSYADSRVLCKKLVDMRKVPTYKSMPDLFALKIRELSENEPEKLIAYKKEMLGLIGEYLSKKYDGDTYSYVFALVDEIALYEKLLTIKCLDEFERVKGKTLRESFEEYNQSIDEAISSPIGPDEFLASEVGINPRSYYGGDYKSAVDEFLCQSFMTSDMDLDPDKEMSLPPEGRALFNRLSAIKMKIIFG